MILHAYILALKDLMMVQWRTETCRPNSNIVNEDTYIVVFDGLINILQILAHYLRFLEMSPYPFYVAVTHFTKTAVETFE